MLDGNADPPLCCPQKRACTQPATRVVSSTDGSLICMHFNKHCCPSGSASCRLLCPRQRMTRDRLYTGGVDQGAKLYVLLKVQAGYIKEKYMPAIAYVWACRGLETIGFTALSDDKDGRSHDDVNNRNPAASPNASGVCHPDQNKPACATSPFSQPPSLTRRNRFKFIAPKTTSSPLAHRNVRRPRRPCHRERRASRYRGEGRGRDPRLQGGSSAL